VKIKVFEKTPLLRYDEKTKFNSRIRVDEKLKFNSTKKFVLLFYEELLQRVP